MATSWSHAGDFTLSTAAASLHRLMGGPYDRPRWARLGGPEFLKVKGDITTQPGTLRRMAAELEEFTQQALTSKTQG